MPSSFAGLLFSIQAGSALGQELHRNHGYKSSEQWVPRTHVGDVPLSEDLMAEEAVPAHFDWRNVDGRSYVTADWNQHIPQYCGACWVHGTVSALNDRIKVMRRGRFPDVLLGRQTVVNCVPPGDFKGPPPGCDGGDSWLIHRYMHTTKIPDESCMPYQARNMGCEANTICRNCAPGAKGCWPVKNYIGYGVSSYGRVVGEKAMMKEIYARGPIACSFSTDSDFMYKFSEVVIQHEGVYLTDKRYNASQIDHVMEVAGWGETASGLKYWVVRNSWGTFWGQGGWLKLRRGVDELMSESDCAWAVPTFEDLDESLAGKVLGDYTLGSLTLEETEKKIEDAAPKAATKLAAVPVATSSDSTVLYGQQALAQQAPSAGSVPVAILGAFLAGISVALIAVKVATRSQVQEQPFILG